MQDIHFIGTGGGGGGGRLFGGVDGSNGGDRRLRPHHHNHHHTPPAMKCPRCESLNTKFCYYNNYNLSQPRYFCKSCRRYWTKGGVLRNVPVGGGCRKTKPSRSKSNSNYSGVRKSSNSQNSSSDSSTLTVKTTKTTAATATTATTTTVKTNLTATPVLNFHETITPTTGSVNIPNSDSRNPSFDPQCSSENNNSMFSEIGTFTSLITSLTPQISQSPLGFTAISPFRSSNRTEWLETEQQSTIGEELKVQNPFTEDWNNGTDQALFDLSGTIDQSFWKWSDHDQDQGDDHQLNYLP